MNDFIEGALEDNGDQAAADAVGGRDIVGATRGFHLVEKPQALLRKRRGISPAALGWMRWSSAGSTPSSARRYGKSSRFSDDVPKAS